MRRASAAAMGEFAASLFSLELRPTDCTVLLMIDANPNITQSELTRMLDIASANMAPLVSRLATRELVVRQPVDGRSHGLSLAPAGQRLVAQAKKLVEEHEQKLLARVPVAHRKHFLAALQALWSSEASHDD
jgi:DNA-binding MarR family transcriptional regulator